MMVWVGLSKVSVRALSQEDVLNAIYDYETMPIENSQAELEHLRRLANTDQVAKDRLKIAERIFGKRAEELCYNRP